LLFLFRLADTADAGRLQTLKEHLGNYPGSAELVLVDGLSEKKQAIKLPEKISSEDESIDVLVQLFGMENVKVVDV
jgi:hypothetical protein